MKKAARILMIIATLIITVALFVACGNNGQHTDGYTVTYVTNGGSAVASAKVAKIETEPVTTRGGYEFAGWYDNAGLNGSRITFPYTLSKDTTLYAKWTDSTSKPDNGYLVTFVTFGGSEVPAVTAKKIESEPQTTWEGYDFLGWYDNGKFEGERIAFPYSVSKAITLYARWEEKPVSDWVQTVLADYDTAQNDDGTINIVKYIGNKENIILPVDANITFADDFLYQEEPTVKAVYIPDNILEVHYYWFYYCSQLREIAVSENHTSLSVSSGVLFSKDGTTLYSYPRAKAATAYTVPDTVKTIGIYAFGANEAIEHLTLSEGVETLSFASFYYMRNLKSISIPTTVKNINGYCFASCAMLSEIELPSTVSTIESKVFDGCSGLKRIIGPVAICGKLNELESLQYVKINGGTTLPSGAFNNCTSLTTVELCSGIETVKSRAFRGCTSLKRVEFPEGVTSIGGNVFTLSGVEEIRLPSSLQTLGSLYDVPALKTVYCSADAITKLFVGLPIEYKSTLQNLIITSGDSIPNTGRPRDAGLVSLHTLVIPASVRSIDEGAFAECSALVQVTNLSGVDWTPYLYSNSGQRVPSGVEIRRSEETAFEGVISMESNGFVKYKYKNEVRVLDHDRNRTFENLTASDFAGYTNIGGYAFNNCASLKSIDIPSNIKTIGEHAFYGCKELSSLTIAEGVESIGSNAFTSTENLKSVTIPHSVASMGMQVFINNNSSEKLTINVEGYAERPEGWNVSWYLYASTVVNWNA